MNDSDIEAIEALLSNDKITMSARHKQLVEKDVPALIAYWRTVTKLEKGPLK